MSLSIVYGQRHRHRSTVTVTVVRCACLGLWGAGEGGDLCVNNLEHLLAALGQVYM